MAMDLLPTATLLTPSSIATGNAPTNDIKQQFRYIYNLAKQFDQQKQTIKALCQIFDPKIESVRIQLADLSTSLIYQTEYEAIARKSREILWFKGYYDLISLGKRFWKKQDAENRPEHQMSNLIIEGIAHFKSVVVNLERHFELDLRNTVDFSFLDTYEQNMLFSTAAIQHNGKNEDSRDKTDDHKKYALETVHALLISLGDLHRYFIDFNFNMPKISKDSASNYYFEAFKLNPKTGMSQNQLGTLFTGLNYDLDSIYHYLYSLVCPVPFELSDVNVGKLFQANSEYLEKIEGTDVVGTHDLIARFILIVDVFFYDKDINDFNSLCHCMLMDFRKVLQSKRIDLSADILFKMIAILLFCLVKLKSMESSKVHHLNAFLVALCAELVSSCTLNLEQFISNKKEQNDRFQLKYGKRFDEFEQNVRRAREKHKQYLENGAVPLKSKANDDIKNEFDSGKNSSTETGGNKLSSESGNQVITKLRVNGMDRDMDAAGGSSGRERESDMGKLSLSSQNKNKKKQLKLRRRRKRANSDDSDSDLSCNDDSDSDYELDTDFSSDEDSVNDYWSSSENEEDEFETTMTNGRRMNGSGEKVNSKNLHENGMRSTSSSPAVNGRHTNGHLTNSDDDIVIEEEEIVYLNGNGVKSNVQRFTDSPTKNSYFTNNLFDNMNNTLNFHLSEGSDDVIVEEEQLIYGQFANLNIYQNGQDLSSVDASKSSSQDMGSKPNNGSCSGEQSDSKSPPEKLRYKQKYNKIDPNIIIQFVEGETSIRALKILFDWLRINGELLLNCFMTNPEFIDKIFTLINKMNIDIFTRKVFFERHFIDTDNVRESLRSLFDIRTTIPLNEDVLLKEFSALDQSQHLIDWSTPLKLKTTEEEESILRVFKIVDFGFSLCKMKKFKYNFCSRSRNFIQANAGKNRSQKRVRNRDRNKRSGHRRRGRSGRRNRTHRRNDERELNNVVILTPSSNDDRDPDNCDKKTDYPKKSYLKNRANLTTASDDTKKDYENGLNKHELMGKLWLQHEIEVLEAKVSKKSMLLTPYLVVDTKALINHFNIIKNLIKTKKFVVLVPKAVIADIDDLKKSSEAARNVTRWLETEFTRGNRFVRLQRLNETKPISLIKIPKKIDRDASAFVQITQFCNYMIGNHVDNNEKNNGIKSNGDSEYERPKIVTLLTGEKLTDKKCSNLSYTGILNAMSINFEQISVFYAKYKNK